MSQRQESSHSNEGEASVPHEEQQQQQPTSVPRDMGFEERLNEWEEHGIQEFDPSKYTELATQLSETGWLSLVKHAYYNEKLIQMTFKKTYNENDWIFRADEVLSTVEPAVLEAICLKNLPQLCESNAQIQRTLDLYSERSIEQPSVYIQFLVLDDGSLNSLTIKQARDLVVLCEQYANQVLDAYQVDKVYLAHNWHKEDSHAGRRYFLENSQGKTASSKKRIMLAFARVLEHNANHCESEGLQFIPYLTYAGYAFNAAAREKRIEAVFNSTEWLVMFVLTAMTMCNVPVKMTDYTVCLITEKEGGPVAEILMAQLARSYYYSGGLRVGQAGVNMESIEMADKTEEERVVKWIAHINFVADCTNYQKTRTKELELRKKQQRRPRDKKIAAMKKELALAEKEDDELIQRRDTMKSGMDVELWRSEFPEQYATFQRLDDYVEKLLKERREA